MDINNIKALGGANSKGIPGNYTLTRNHPKNAGGSTGDIFFHIKPDYEIQLTPRSAGQPAVDSLLDAMVDSSKHHQALFAASHGGANPQSAVASHAFFATPAMRNLDDIATFLIGSNGLTASMTPESVAQAAALKPASDSTIKDMRNMNWVSIDNDDSKDLDQISVAEKLPNGDVKLYVAIADVDALAPKGSAIDKQAALNTQTIYTPTKKYWMIPERLTTDLTSLNSGEDRQAMVAEMTVAPDGNIRSYNFYPAMVNNHAKLAYNSTAAWLEGKGPMPDAMNKSGIPEQIRLQDQVAQKFKALREKNGAIDFETLKPQPIVQNGQVVGLGSEERNRANDLIENVMVAANGCAARFLKDHNYPVLQRVVYPPTQRHWSELVTLADGYGYKLSPSPNSRDLQKFLDQRRAQDPKHYPDVSLAVLKLMGRGFYELEKPGESPIGHFGLAVSDYTHSTAPNRRYPDLITQRMLKAAAAGKPCPYTESELQDLALNCTKQEGAIKQVDRHLIKSATALYLEPKVGQKFRAIVSESTKYGTFVRLLDLPVEGMLSHAQGAHMGQTVSVRLDRVDIENGHINFSITKQKAQKAA